MFDILPSCSEQLKTLAQVWLENGATTFSIWAQDRLLEKWRNGSQESGEIILSSIRVDGRTIGDVRVTGANWRGAEKRLAADAKLISDLLSKELERKFLAEELVVARDQLVSLYSLIDVTRKTKDIVSLLNIITAEASKMVQSQGVFFILQLEDQKQINAFYPKPTDLSPYLLNIIQSLPPRSRPFLYSGGLNGSDSSVFKNFLLIPFKVYSAKVAVLGFFNKTDSEFRSADLKLGCTIADYAGSQIENLLMIRSNSEIVRSETEIELAQKIQESLLPKGVPDITGLNLEMFLKPASRIGGDFYDFIFQSKRKVNIVIGDISGKGMPAALLMAMTLKVLRSETKRPSKPTPNKIIHRSNDILYQDYNDAVSFSTIFIGQFDMVTREFTYSNAGHSPIIYCPLGQKAEILKADSVPLGLFPDMKPKTSRLKINPGDIMVMATDGINETSNLSARLLGISQLTKLVEKLADHSAMEIKDGILQAVQIHGAGKSQEDDQTVIVIKGCH